MTSASNPMALAQGTNEILGGYVFGYFVLFVIMFTLFFSLKAKGYQGAASFAVACWLSTIIALFLRGMSLLDNYVFWGMLLLSAVSAGLLYLSGNAD